MIFLRHPVVWKSVPCAEVYLPETQCVLVTVFCVTSTLLRLLCVCVPGHFGIKVAKRILHWNRMNASPNSATVIFFTVFKMCQYCVNVVLVHINYTGIISFVISTKPAEIGTRGQCHRDATVIFHI